MDQDMSFSTSVLNALVKTNRPPTDQERAIIRESIAPTEAKLKVVDGKISEMMAHIEALKSQVEQAEIKLQRLQDERGAILDTFANHDRVFSPFRNLPEDILREICVACVQGDPIPTLVGQGTALPYRLGQICSGMRHVALTTPLIWASVRIRIGLKLQQVFSPRTWEYLAYPVLARRAIEWFGRTGELALTVIIEDSSSNRARSDDSYDSYDSDSNGRHRHSDPASILVDAILSYSTRWKEFQFTACREGLSPSMMRITALTALDVPMLQSISFFFNESDSDLELHDSQLLRIPTLRNVTLGNAVRMFTVNWAILTSITLRGDTQNQIGKILQQTKCLAFCNVVMRRSNDYYPHKINLPFLKTLIISEETRRVHPPDTYDLYKLITAPNLETLDTRLEFFDLSSLSDFLERSPRIWKLSLLYFEKDKSLMDTVGILRHCHSLTAFSLYDHVFYWDSYNANQFLRAFVEEADDGVICPRLQDFEISGKFDFSIETLRMFLERKQGDIDKLNISQWRRVTIDISGIKSEQKAHEIRDLVSQKKAEGVNVCVYSES